MKTCKHCGAECIKPRRVFCSTGCYKRFNINAAMASYRLRYKADPEFRAHRVALACKLQQAKRDALWKPNTKECKVCGAPLTHRRTNAKACSPACCKIRRTLQDLARFKTGKYRFSRKLYQRKLMKDPVFRLRKNVSRLVHFHLTKKSVTKNGSILDYLPYTIPQLKAHLEAQFNNINGFSWENYGSVWELDHIIPHSLFYYTSMDCKVFRDCWALSNLQPLTRKENRWKKDKVLYE